jgi:hypothetical protein
MKKILYIVLFAITNVALFATDFTDYMSSIPYDSVKQKLSNVEQREFDKIYFENGLPYYDDKLIKLYLTVSGIVDENEFNSYLQQFESLVQKSRGISGINSLNNYNKAERLLHFLHDESFATELKGPAAGYNIGIRETLDHKRYNCYKSALIYNSLLDYYGYNTYLVLVPEHIYSVVIVDGKEIPVETTNRFGFDPFNAGDPEFKRKFDKPNITLRRTNYRKRTPINNISVVGIVYSNQILLYAGKETYPGYPVTLDYEKAALLGVLGLYVMKNEAALGNNALIPFYHITENSIQSDPLKLETELDRYNTILSIDYLAPYAKPFKRNKNVLLLQNIDAYREKKYGVADSLSISELNNSFANTLNFVENISTDDGITDSIWNNSLIVYSDALEVKTKENSYTSIKLYIDSMRLLMQNSDLQKSKVYSKYNDRLKRYGSVRLNNYIAELMNSEKYEQALSEGKQAIAHIKDIDYYDSRVIKTLESNIEKVEKFLQQ